MGLQESRAASGRRRSNRATAEPLERRVLLAAAYAMLGGIPAQAAVTRWFRRRRGMALSLVTMGISSGGVVMVPLTQVMLDRYGWRFALGAIGVGILLVMLPPVFLFMRDYPEQVGQSPDAGDASEFKSELTKLAKVGAPLNHSFDAVGLQDCGSRQQ